MSDFDLRYYQNKFNGDGPIASSEDVGNLNPADGLIRGPFRVKHPVAFNGFPHGFLMYIEKCKSTGEKEYKIHRDFAIQGIGGVVGGDASFQGGVRIDRINLIRLLVNMEKDDCLVFCKPEDMNTEKFRDIIIESIDK